MVTTCFSRGGSVRSTGALLLLVLALIGAFPGQSTAKDVTPTDVFYLATGIGQSLMDMHGFTLNFQKQRLTNSAKPRNVFQRVVFLAEEYNGVHGNPIDAELLEAARAKDASTIKPQDVYGVLELIKKDLESKGAYVEYAGERRAKTPSDVFQLLRKVSACHAKIAKQKGMASWAGPARVYEANVTQVVPMLYTMAAESGVKYDSFYFPPNAVEGIKPRHIYMLQQTVYRSIGEYYKKKTGYSPIVFDKIKDLDSITPGEVFDLTQIIIGELKVLQGGTAQLNAAMTKRYTAWKKSKKKILPGDVYHLVQHNFNLAKQIAAR